MNGPYVGFRGKDGFFSFSPLDKDNLGVLIGDDGVGSGCSQPGHPSNIIPSPSTSILVLGLRSPSGTPRPLPPLRFPPRFGLFANLLAAREPIRRPIDFVFISSFLPRRDRLKGISNSLFCEDISLAIIPLQAKG